MFSMVETVLAEIGHSGFQNRPLRPISLFDCLFSAMNFRVPAEAGGHASVNFASRTDGAQPKGQLGD
jgi:hypothetical protein